MFLILPVAALAVTAMANAAYAQVSPYYDSTTFSAIPDTNHTIFVTGTVTESVKAASLFEFSNPPVTPLSVSFAAGAAESITTPIIPGEKSVTANVGVVYKI